jgi:GTP:adenosylcobinamide-phosphate guanylyltransferase
MPAAVVLAGGSPEPRLAPGLPNKAFFSMGGRPLVVRVTEALRGCPSIDRIVVIGPPGPLASLLNSSIEIIPERDSMMDNISAAAALLQAVPQVLGVAADLPLLTAEAVEGFLQRCTGGADFYYSIVPQACIETRFPGVHKTYVKVTDGTFCGGSAILFSPRVIDRIRPFIEQIINARKKPWLLAQLFGWSIVMKFASGRLSAAEMETRAHEITGLHGRAVIVEAPELALDVDATRPENIEILRAALEPPGRSGT